VAVQRALDPAFPDGGRYYFKSHFLDRLDDDAIDTLLACDAKRPNPQSLIVIRTSRRRDRTDGGVRGERPATGGHPPGP
jgi:hypothetical protein